MMIVIYVYHYKVINAIIATVQQQSLNLTEKFFVLRTVQDKYFLMGKTAIRAFQTHNFVIRVCFKSKQSQFPIVR